MATGDVTVFEEARAYLIDGDFNSTDQIWIALITNATNPTAADSAPDLSDYTECTPGGTYASGGELLDTLTNMVTEVGGTVTFDDTGASVTWAKNASNPQDAYWGLIYNYTDAGDRAIAFIELGGPIDMQAGDLTITWHANGIFRIT